MLRSSRTRLTRAEGEAILRTAFGDATAPASRCTRPGPACPSFSSSSPPPTNPSGSIGTGGCVPPLVNTRASSKLLPSTPASTSSSLLSPLVSSLGERSCQPLSSVNHLLPRGFASAAFATTLFNPLRHTLLRASLPGNTTCFIPSPTTSSRFFSSSSSTASSAPPSGFLSWYLAFLDSHPVVTKALTACTIFTVADVTSQYLAYILDEVPVQAASSNLAPAGTDSLALAARGFQWDQARTMRMGAAGLILSGPTLHMWYGLMARWRPGTDALSIAQKMLAGTIFYGPAFNAAFFSANGALQGEGSREIAGRLKRDLFPTLVNGLMYWPFCDVLTYRFVPVHLQLMGSRITGPRSLHSLSRVGASTGEPWQQQQQQQTRQQQQEEQDVPRGSWEETGEHRGRRGGVGGWSLSQTCRQFSSLFRPAVPTATQVHPRPVTPPQSTPFSRLQPVVAMSTACHRVSPSAAHNQRQMYPFQSSRPPFSRFQPSASLSTAQQRLPQLGVGLRGVPVSFGVAAVENEMRTSVLGPAWAGAGRARGFVQLRTILDVADNSGAKRVMCIKVLKGAKPNAAVIGDIIIASVRDADFHGKVKKGEVVTCVVVRSAMAKRRSDGSMIRFDGPAAVVINKSGEPVGTRVFGPVPHELRAKKLVKVLALAQLVT